MLNSKKEKLIDGSKQADLTDTSTVLNITIIHKFQLSYHMFLIWSGKSTNIRKHQGFLESELDINGRQSCCRLGFLKAKGEYKSANGHGIIKRFNLQKENKTSKSSQQVKKDLSVIDQEFWSGGAVWRLRLTAVRGGGGSSPARLPGTDLLSQLPRSLKYYCNSSIQFQRFTLISSP